MNVKLKKIYEQLLQEKKGDVYDYGCAMVYFNFPLINKIQDAINPNDLYEEEGDKTYGLEDEPHVTLLYGFHKDVKINQINKIINKFTFYTCILHNISLFESEKYDVLKFDVKDCDFLYQINKELSKLPHTTDYPDYHPHLTIGYLKKGKGEKYIKQFKKFEFELIPKYVIYSKPNGDKIQIKINID